MFASGATRLLSGIALSTCGLASISSSSTRAAFGCVALLRTCGSYLEPFKIIDFGSGPTATYASFSAQASGLPDAGSTAYAIPAAPNNDRSREGSGGAPDISPGATSAAAALGGSTTHLRATASVAPAAGLPSSLGPTSDVNAVSLPAAAAGEAPSAPASRRDKSASADVVYPSSRDDNLGVQRNWFNALFTQLNVIQRTGMAPHLKGRQKEVFEAVEREFEVLWVRHVRGKGLEGVAHRGMLMCCLAIATHKVLMYETGDDALVREVVRTNLGGTAVGLMMRLHKLRLWLLLKLLAEDPYKQAVRFLPSLHGDMGSLVVGEVAEGDSEATWTATSCKFHSVLAEEGATELLPEFCCQFSMQWLEVFSQYGVRVGLEESVGFGDECCKVRISRPAGTATPASRGSSDG
ncbi:hypothetical protein VaNZ11_001206 [Volvox africanus]|uniref:4-vinyl reductase 4VR domain-containing protein n=1 Tax=Volvox africanus TaxID=51714 RepID=A0ABQ5RQ26_9CHLO|nr:hypothetical protein VaNZ11_001206 [Volvox africanus]